MDARIIAAANQNLREMTTKGTFREDLFHLDLLRFSIPTLSSRGNGILKIAGYFLTLKSIKLLFPLSDETKTKLLNYPWPGNARELIHELERALVMSGDAQDIELTLPEKTKAVPEFEPDSKDWLVKNFRFPAEGFDLEREIIRLIEISIAQTGGNISQAARLLGVPRDYVRYRLQK